MGGGTQSVREVRRLRVPVPDPVREPVRPEGVELVTRPALRGRRGGRGAGIVVQFPAVHGHLLAEQGGPQGDAAPGPAQEPGDHDAVRPIATGVTAEGLGTDTRLTSICWSTVRPVEFSEVIIANGFKFAIGQSFYYG